MKYIKLFENQGEALNTELLTPFVGSIRNIHKVMYASKKKFGDTVTIVEKDNDFIQGKLITEDSNYVDLGLPSGLLWAKCNVGATLETEYGKYFQWGDTVGYTAKQVASGEKVFNFNTTPYQTNASAGISYSASKFTKYLGSTTSSYKDPSATDEDALKTVLDPIDDAATQLMGADWRMPTEADFNELLANTNREWVENYNDSGKNGYLFRSQKDMDKYIFIPVAGHAYGSSVDLIDRDGYMWCSSLYPSHPFDGHVFLFDEGDCLIDGSYRCDGFSVRGVCE